MLRPIVFSGPSGSGKSTLLNLLSKEFPDTFGFSVSHTTRKPRPGEVDGKQYHFTTAEVMQGQIKEGRFIEHAQFSGNLYGTSESAVRDVLKSDRICLLDIDEQGVKSMKGTAFDPLYVFISPPSLEALRTRLESRGTESRETIERRMDTATSALEYSHKPGVYDIIIVNDILEKAYEELRDFILKHNPQITMTTLHIPSDNGDSPSSPAKFKPTEVGAEVVCDVTNNLVVTDRSSAVVAMEDDNNNNAFCGNTTQWCIVL